MLRYLKGYLLPISILALAILGARLQNEYFLYAMVVLICLTLCLAAFSRIDEKSYPYIVFSIGLALIYQTTLLSPYIVGTDNHGEFFYAWRVLTTGTWDYSIPWAYNTALGSTLLAPLISTIFKIPLEWVFKAVFPLFLAVTPVVLFFILKRFFSSKVSFLSVFFFMAIPTYILELPAIGKEQVAELFLVLGLYLLLVPRFKLPLRLTFISLCGILASLAHYTVGIIFLLFLVGLLLLLPFFKNRLIPLKYLTIVVVVVMVLSLGFFNWTASGYTFNKLEIIGITLVNKLPGVSLEVEGIPDSLPEPGPRPDFEPDFSYFGGHTSTVRAVFGLDFMGSSLLGRAFRVLQYGTQLLVILGGIYVWLRRRRMGLSSEYKALFLASWILLGACMLIPGISAIINATRFYHFSLFLLAPTLILGGKMVLRNYRILVLCLLIPYFLFTSGFIFEAAKIGNIERLEIPYTHAFSATRVDTTGVFTKNDGEVRDWLVRNRTEGMEIFGDVHSMYFLIEKWGLAEGLEYLALGEEIPEGGYLYLREWNESNGKITYWTGIGQRKSVPYWGNLIDGRRVLYERGEAKVYGPK